MRAADLVVPGSARVADMKKLVVSAVVVVLVLLMMAQAMGVDLGCLIRCSGGGSRVCGWNRQGDWRTFYSKCALANFNCLHDTDYELVVMEPCESLAYSWKMTDE